LFANSTTRIAILTQLKHIGFNLEKTKPFSNKLEGNTAMVKQKMHSFCILALTEHHIKRPVQCTMVDFTSFSSDGFNAATIPY
jgi:hypothetical protein